MHLNLIKPLSIGHFGSDGVGVGVGVGLHLFIYGKVKLPLIFIGVFLID